MPSVYLRKEDFKLVIVEYGVCTFLNIPTATILGPREEETSFYAEHLDYAYEYIGEFN